MYSPHTYGTTRQGMKATEPRGLVYQLLWSWLRAIRESTTLLSQFAKYQAQWVLEQVSSNHLLQTLCPCLGSYIRKNAQLTTNPKQEQEETANSRQSPKDQHNEDGATSSSSKRENTSLPSQSIYSLFDGEGRLDIFRMRKLVYERGTHPSERKITWKFLFGVYPEKSTTEERRELDQQMISQYHWMKQSWKQRFPWAATMRVHSDLELCLAIQKHDEQQRELDAAKPSTNIYNEDNLPLQYIDERQFQQALKDIDVDVPQTDRHRTFFQCEGLVNLLYLRDILITYVAFHQDIGYCHGMNDFASRFLETLDNETEAFWCFVGYMRRSAWRFTTMGVRRKTQICEEVLRHVDPELYSHIESVSKEKLIFCLRWLLLLFQKDLDHQDAVRVLEISALETEKMNFGAWIWRTRREGEEVPAPFSSVDRDEITFEVLLCIAVLIQNRKQLLQYHDVNDFFLFAQRLQGRLQLNTLHGEERT
ncbi:TBC1 domain family member 15-like [Sceloporus undulatus]|uniref:TBC1 domain family member 15-like n=1 Tax=Sceloporus undulatus TaxID=8520 RepID=UPI001C4BB6B8|nr:TBC1 domain family member 15-like [Sceloporus undulatus]